MPPHCPVHPRQPSAAFRPHPHPYTPEPNTVTCQIADSLRAGVGDTGWDWVRSRFPFPPSLTHIFPSLHLYCPVSGLQLPSGEGSGRAWQRGGSCECPCFFPSLRRWARPGYWFLLVVSIFLCERSAGLETSLEAQKTWISEKEGPGGLGGGVGEAEWKGRKG